MRALVLMLACCAGLSGCASVPASRPEAPAVASATLTGADGTVLGSISLRPAGDGYRLSGRLTGLAPAAHGMHLHATGKCEGPAFTSAGPHLNPGLHEHGTMNPKGPHLGDLPNVVADQAGVATLDVELRGTRGDLDRDLFDADGTALVLHAGQDDYRTDPSGGSGGRIACGVLVRR